MHRLTGLFVAAGFTHALLDATPFAPSPLLRWTFIVVGGTGLAFYAYRELLARHFVPLGDGTARLPHAVRPGMPAVIGGPFGRFSHAKGTTRQLWVAGGIGVTPFLSWLRDLGQHPPPGLVDFFYSSSAADMPYADEIRGLAARSDLIRVHLVDSRQGHLTAERIMAEAGASRVEPISVFLCGPAGMVRDLQSGFRRLGVPGRRVYREQFDWR